MACACGLEAGNTAIVAVPDDFTRTQLEGRLRNQIEAGARGGVRTARITSDNTAEFPALFQYSPYHNLKPGTRYPATLVMTADHDDRVVPAHSLPST